MAVSSSAGTYRLNGLSINRLWDVWALIVQGVPLGLKIIQQFRELRLFGKFCHHLDLELPAELAVLECGGFVLGGELWVFQSGLQTRQDGGRKAEKTRDNRQLRVVMRAGEDACAYRRRNNDDGNA